MPDTIDTRMISLNEPVSEGMLKMLDHRARWDIDPSCETSDVPYFQDEGYSQPSKLKYMPDKPISFCEWLGVATVTFSEPRIAAITAILSAAIVIDPRWTFYFDPGPILKAMAEEKSAVVSISPTLIMPRTQVRASSLLAPSGAYLTWVEMLAEDLDDRSK